MRNPHFFLLVPILFIYTVSCTKENNTTGNCLDETVFCSAVNSGNIAATLPVIDNYISTLDAADTNTVHRVNDYILCKSCVISSIETCCVETLPPQVEYYIGFVNAGDTIYRWLDIQLGNPLKALRFHE